MVDVSDRFSAEHLRVVLDQVSYLSTNRFYSCLSSTTLVSNVTVPANTAHTIVLTSVLELNPHITFSARIHDAALKLLRQVEPQFLVCGHEPFEKLFHWAQVRLLKQLHCGQAPIPFENDKATISVWCDQLKLSRVEPILSYVLGKP
ncbi:hypothetical protein D3C79_736310 [compost metagenome]